MAETNDPFLGPNAVAVDDDPFLGPQAAPNVTPGVKGRVYGPIVGETYRDAMVGAYDNPLGPKDVALSPDLQKKYPLGSNVLVNNKGPYKVADHSYTTPGNPNTNTVELRDTANPPARVTLSDAPVEDDPFVGGAADETPSEAPVPHEPNWLEKTEVALRDYVGGAVPTSLEDVGRMSNVPTDWTNPKQVVKFVMPMTKPMLDLADQAIGRIQQIAAAEKTAPGSQARYTAGIGTVIDLLGTAAGLKGIAKVQPLIPVGAATTAAEAAELGVRGSGKFRQTYKIDKELGDRMEGIGASRESGAFRGEIASRNLLDDLFPEQEADLGRYLVSRRLRNVNPEHPQIMSPAEMARVEADPAIAKALVKYKTEIEPEVQAIHERAGVTQKAPDYISLVPKTDEPLPMAGQVPTSKLSRTTKFAKPAEGMAKEYDTNLRNILNQTYSEPLKKARLREFYAASERKGLVGKKVMDTPEGPREVIDPDSLHPQLQHDLRAATEKSLKPTGLLKGVRAVQRGATSVALTANPPELVNHMRRQLNVLSAKPPVGRGLLARLEFLIPYIGPKTGAFARTVFDNADLPEFRSVLKDVIDSGGGSARSFGNMYKLRGAFAQWTGLKWLQSKTHNLLFGVPKGKGFNGWDLRMRVQLERIRRSAEGNVDPQRIREFANQIGQYGSHPDWVISALREVNPYAATTLPMRWTEMKNAVGISGLKSGSVSTKLFRQAETLLRGTGGTILGLTAANYLFSGKWPWQNDAGHEFDLNTGLTGKDGKRIYAKFRVIAPELSRPISTVGIPNLARERTAENPQYLSAFAAALGNQGLSIIGGPAQNTVLTATTGLVPYVVKSPGGTPALMDVAKTEKGQSRGVEQLKRAVASLNPLGETLVNPNYEPDLPPALSLLERPIGGFKGVRPFGSMFTESYEKKRSRRRQTASQKAASARRKARD